MYYRRRKLFKAHGMGVAQSGVINGSVHVSSLLRKKTTAFNGIA